MTTTSQFTLSERNGLVYKPHLRFLAQDLSKKVRLIHESLRNISKTSASVSSGVPNTEKLMKARGRRPSAFIVSRCLEPLMKHEARVFDMASQMRQ